MSVISKHLITHVWNAHLLSVYSSKPNLVATFFWQRVIWTCLLRPWFNMEQMLSPRAAINFQQVCGLLLHWRLTQILCLRLCKGMFISSVLLTEWLQSYSSTESHLLVSEWAVWSSSYILIKAKIHLKSSPQALTCQGRTAHPIQAFTAEGKNSVDKPVVQEIYVSYISEHLGTEFLRYRI